MIAASIGSTLAGLFIVYIIILGQDLSLISERFFQNSDSIFMYFPEHEVFSEKICSELGLISPVHRGLGALLGNESAKDPTTIFGIALNNIADRLEIEELSGPNAMLPSWSHCYYGVYLGTLMSATLLAVYAALCKAKINFKRNSITFELAWLFVLFSAASFYQEVSVLTSAISQLAIVLILYWLNRYIVQQ